MFIRTHTHTHTYIFMHAHIPHIHTHTHTHTDRHDRWNEEVASGARPSTTDKKHKKEAESKPNWWANDGE
jgi:hypothetical protein